MFFARLDSFFTIETEAGEEVLVDLTGLIGTLSITFIAMLIAITSIY